MTTESVSSFQKLLDGFPNEAKAKGDAFEKCIKWLIQNEHSYTSQFSRVWLWNEWPGLIPAWWLTSLLL